MKKKTCFFIGHREAGAEIKLALTEAVERAIVTDGIEEFIVGHYGGFDRMASAIVAAAKAEYPYIRLYQLLPYHPAERSIELPKGFDGSIYPDGMEKTPRKVAIVRANRYAVDHCDYLIAYAWHPASNSRNLVEYAQDREQRGLITVILLEKP